MDTGHLGAGGPSPAGRDAAHVASDAGSLIDLDPSPTEAGSLWDDLRSLEITTVSAVPISSSGAHPSSAATASMGSSSRAPNRNAELHELFDLK